MYKEKKSAEIVMTCYIVRGREKAGWIEEEQRDGDERERMGI